MSKQNPDSLGTVNHCPRCSSRQRARRHASDPDRDTARPRSTAAAPHSWSSAQPARHPSQHAPNARLLPLAPWGGVPTDVGGEGRPRGGGLGAARRSKAADGDGGGLGATARLGVRLGFPDTRRIATVRLTAAPRHIARSPPTWHHLLSPINCSNHPSVTTASLLSKTRYSPRAHFSPWLMAAGNPRLVEFAMTVTGTADASCTPAR